MYGSEASNFCVIELKISVLPLDVFAVLTFDKLPNVMFDEGTVETEATVFVEGLIETVDAEFVITVTFVAIIVSLMEELLRYLQQLWF
jgi:hypothetical protein